MIGKVVFEVGGRPAVATLGDEGVWSVAVDQPDNDEINRILADDFDINYHLRDYSPADGRRGYKQLHRAAADWNGRVDAPEPPPAPPGLIY